MEPIKKISSPYTIDYNRKKIIPSYLIYVVIFLLVLVIAYLVFTLFDGNEFKDERGVIYEFTEQINCI